MNNRNLLLKRGVVSAIAVFCCLLWGSAAPCIKIAYRLFSIGSSDIKDQILLAGIRFFFAGVLTILFGSLISRKPLIPKGKESLKMIVSLAMVQTVIQYFFFFVGVANTTGFKTAIINGTGTFFSILAACFVFRYEKMTARKILGCLLGFVAIVIINLNSADGSGSFTFLGDGFLFLSVLSNALVAGMIKRFSKKENPVVLSGYQFMLGGLIMAAGAFILGGRLHASNPSAYLIVLYLSFVAAAAYTLWSVLLKYNPVSAVTIFVPVNPISGVFLSAFLLGEADTIDWGRCLVALVLITLGILAVNTEKRS